MKSPPRPPLCRSELSKKKVRQPQGAGTDRDTGASRSELIRRAVRATFGEQDKEEKLRALKASAGSWRGRRRSGAEYVDALRGGDLNERLARLGVK